MPGDIAALGLGTGVPQASAEPGVGAFPEQPSVIAEGDGTTSAGGASAALAGGFEAPGRRPEEEGLYWQLHNAYVLVQIKGGLVLVDQHAAHERILFDRAVAALEGRMPSVQRLLFPITLELAVRQFAAFEEASPLLEQLGFQVRPFGARSVLVEGIPAEIRNWDEGAVLLGMLDVVGEE